MTFLQLEYFCAVAETGSISQVAKRYNISPAALSRSIGQLERELGVELFNHQGRSITINDNGQLFRHYATAALEAMTEARGQLRNAAHQQLIRLRNDVPLGDPGALAVALRLALPDLQVEILEPQSQSNRYDLRLFATHNRIRTHDCEHVCSEDYVLALPAKHPLAQSRLLGLESLKDEDFIAYKEAGHEELLRFLCGKVGYVPHIAMSFDAASPHGVYRAIAAGIGVSVVPRQTSLALWDSDEIRYMPISDIKFTRFVYAKTRDGAPLNDNHLRIVDVIKSELKLL